MEANMYAEDYKMEVFRYINCSKHKPVMLYKWRSNSYYTITSLFGLRTLGNYNPVSSYPLI